MGLGPANPLQVLLERAFGPLADPYRTRLGRPLGSPVSNSLETPCSVPSEGNMVPSPFLLAERRRRGVQQKSRWSSIILSLRAEARGLLSHRATAKLSTTSTNQLKNSRPDHALGLRPGRMREQQGRPRHHITRRIKTSEESNYSSEASGATPDGCARAHPSEQNITKKGWSLCKNPTEPPSEYLHSLRGSGATVGYHN
jgi:hypothetical protein